MGTSLKLKTKNSGVTWFGDVPTDWQVKKLKFVFKYFTGATPDSGKDKYYSEDGYNWITIADLDGRFTSESKNKITEIAVKDKNMKIAPEGSLLYSFKLSVGQMAFVLKETYTNEAIFAILPDKNVNLDFWYYALQSYLIENASENIYGAKMFNNHLINNSLLLVPPPKTQKNIGRYLDTKVEQIKNFIDDKNKLIELLEEQKTSIIYDAVTKGLDDKIKRKHSGIEWIGNIPENWKTAKLKQIVSIKVSDGPHETPSFSSDGVPFVSVESVFNGKINFEFIRGYITKEQDIIYSEKCKPIKNDIFIVKSGSTTGKVAMIEYDFDFNIWSPLALVRVNAKLVFYKFAFYFFTSEAFQKQIQTFWSFGTQPNIGMGVLENLFLTLPPIQIQKEIVNYIEHKTAKIDQAIVTVKKEIELIEEYKKSLIYQAVTGKIDTLLTEK